MEFHSRLQADKSASTHAIWIPGTVTKPPWHAAPRYQWGGVWKTMWTPIDFPSPLSITTYWHMAVCQNLVPLVNIKIAGKWMFIPLKMVLIGIDPYPYFAIDDIGYAFRLCRTHLNWMHPSLSLRLSTSICRPFLNAPNLETNLHSLQQVQQLTSEWQHQRPWKFQVWISPVRKGSNNVCSLTWIAKWSIIKWWLWWWWWRFKNQRVNTFGMAQYH